MDTIFKNMNRNEIKTILEIGSLNIEKSKELYDVFIQWFNICYFY